MLISAATYGRACPTHTASLTYGENKLKFSPYVKEAVCVVRAGLSDAHGLLDVRRELELVLEVLRREERAVGQTAHVIGAVDDLEVCVVIDDTRVARAHPAILEGLARRLRVLVVALEDAGAPVEHLALGRDPELDAGDGDPHRVEPHVVVLLDGDEHARLGHAVDLLDVDPERAEEDEDLGPDRLARGVGTAESPHPEVVAERGPDEEVPERSEEPAPDRYGRPVEPRLL